MTRIYNSSALVQGSLAILAYYRCSISSAVLSINQEPREFISLGSSLFYVGRALEHLGYIGDIR